jgi:hypothetical protein
MERHAGHDVLVASVADARDRRVSGAEGGVDAAIGVEAREREVDAEGA